MQVNRAIERSYGVACESSNTLEHSDVRHRKTLRGDLVEAAAHAVAVGSVPRRGRTLAVA
jgi:hypothetical protein